MSLSLRRPQRSFPISSKNLPDGWVEYTVRVQGDLGPSLIQALDTLLDLCGCLDAASRTSARQQRTDAWLAEQAKLKADIQWEFYGLLEDGVKFNTALAQLPSHPKFSHLGWSASMFRRMLPRAKDLPFYSSKKSRRVHHDIRGKDSIYRKLLFQS